MSRLNQQKSKNKYKKKGYLRVRLVSETIAQSQEIKHLAMKKEGKLVIDEVQTLANIEKGEHYIQSMCQY
jgi:hypothetical protein